MIHNFFITHIFHLVYCRPLLMSLKNRAVEEPSVAAEYSRVQLYRKLIKVLYIKVCQL